MRLRLKGDVNFCVAAGRRGRNGGGNAIDLLPNLRPFGAARQDHESDASFFQVLLMTNASIGCEQQLEARLLGNIQEGTVTERVPALGLCSVDGVPR
jgi:hypothetical protein